MSFSILDLTRVAQLSHNYFMQNQFSHASTRDLLKDTVLRKCLAPNGVRARNHLIIRRVLHLRTAMNRKAVEWNVIRRVFSCTCFRLCPLLDLQNHLPCTKWVWSIAPVRRKNRNTEDQTRGSWVNSLNSTSVPYRPSPRLWEYFFVTSAECAVTEQIKNGRLSEKLFVWVRFISAVRFEPGTAGYKVRTLPLCYAVPQREDEKSDCCREMIKNPNCLFSCQQHLRHFDPPRFFLFRWQNEKQSWTETRARPMGRDAFWANGEIPKRQNDVLGKDCKHDQTLDES